MKYSSAIINGLWVLEPTIFRDSRGYFAEMYKKEEFDRHIGEVNFIQDNESMSSFGVLRGLHYQEGDAGQAKLVRVIHGAVLDIAVDIRPGSPDFGKAFTIELTAENKKQFFMPRGFAHGFLVLSESAVFNYKVDNVYSPSTERTLNIFDPELNIELPIDKSKLILSDKDKDGLSLKDLRP